MSTASKLKEYRRKRDFSRTAEPAGGRSARHRRLEFVIQKHAASHLHYDLRLEMGGVMKSWAVPKGPSLDPTVRRLAMEVEDHPIEYNTFEGTIPQGEYGGGTVMIWDRGTYEADDVPDGEDEDRFLRKAHHAGKISITFHGERMHGSWALVRTSGGRKPQWLLIKHRDEAAEEGSDITADQTTSVVTGRTMQEITAGIGAKRVWHSNRRTPARKQSRARARTILDDLAPMQSGAAGKLPEGDEWTYAATRGGTVALAFVANDTAAIIVKGADRGPQLPDVTRALLRLRTHAPLALEVELVRDESGVAVAFVTDVLVADGKPLIGDAWTERRKVLRKLFARRRAGALRLAEQLDDAEEADAQARKGGWAGIVARAADSTYTPGERNVSVKRVRYSPAKKRPPKRR